MNQLKNLPTLLLSSILFMQTACQQSFLGADRPAGLSEPDAVNELEATPLLSFEDPLASISFAKDSAKLSMKTRSQIRDVAHKINQVSMREFDVLLTGYSDSEGDQSYNLILSRERAKSVESELLINGVRSNRISIKALGEKDNDANENPQQASEIRRVEILLVKEPLIKEAQNKSD